MRSFLTIAFVLALAVAGIGQTEQAPIIEKNVNYKDWTLPGLRDDKPLNLRNAVAGKKLTIVVYYAAWCPNWRHDVPFLQKFYDKYKDQGLEIIGVSEYDSVASAKNNLNFFNVTFPVVYESTSRADQRKTSHYDIRRSVGDARGWGSPWYILIDAARVEQNGDVIIKTADVINGEMIETEGEAYIRKKLGLPAAATKASVAKDKIEVCDVTKAVSLFDRP
jgi:peroxiredoxin